VSPTCEAVRTHAHVNAALHITSRHWTAMELKKGGRLLSVLVNTPVCHSLIHTPLVGGAVGAALAGQVLKLERDLEENRGQNKAVIQL